MQALKKIIPQSIKNIYHLAQAILANLWHGFPSRKIKVIGVTGTNGKTTTVQMITKILEEAGKRVAMASTINYKINEEVRVNLTHLTTPSPFALQKFIKRAVRSGCEYLILETSSHAIDQYRVWGVDYKTAVVTNVTREHLDYHETIKKYKEAKQRIFRKAECVIVNGDMEKPEDFLQFNNKNKIIYRTRNNGAGVFASNIQSDASGSRFLVNEFQFKLNLLGNFNIENALAAMSVGVAENISLETCAKALEKIKDIPGRMEHISNDKGLNILVDFALTPDALEKFYGTLAKIKNSEAKIIAVFGACGDRDKGNRPLVGEMVARFADYIVLTTDEPYFEDPERIAEEIARGIKICKKDEIPRQARDDNFCFTKNVNLWIILDRRMAIKKAIEIARPGDIIAVTGMGAEESMIVAGRKIPWNDKKVILEELKKRS